MGKTLLLCFIHGFKGDEETFFQFPEDLKNLVAEKCPDLSVQTRVYPKYETRGDLAACATSFREWLQEQVTDLETNAATPQAILNPSVNVILVAHSMGGFVAADTLFSVLDNGPVSPDPQLKLMFPLIQGVLAFDTPYNGLSRSMFAYGAFSQYQNLSSVWNIFSTIAGAGGSASSGQLIATQASSWARWQALAARTGTYGAIAAGGVAAYQHRAEIQQSLSKINRENLSKINRETLSQGMSQGLTYVNRDSIGEGFSWMAGHLKFVGALMKPAQLKTRMERLTNLKGIGIADMYVSLGENGYWTGGYFVPKRTFCAVPTETEAQRLWSEQQNTKASSEIEAHCSMFQPEKNSGYSDMLAAAGDLLGKWTQLDPRKVVDDYTPGQEEAAGVDTEAKLFDDDGKVREETPEPVDGKSEGSSEDEMQLQAILKWQNMPYDDMDEETLKKALEVPLPLEEQETNDSALKEASDVPLPEDEKSRYKAAKEKCIVC